MRSQANDRLGAKTNLPRLGIVTEPLAVEPLPSVLDWLVDEVPQVTDLETGTGAYAPTWRSGIKEAARLLAPLVSSANATVR